LKKNAENTSCVFSDAIDTNALLWNSSLQGNTYQLLRPIKSYWADSETTNFQAQEKTRQAAPFTPSSRFAVGRPPSETESMNTHYSFAPVVITVALLCQPVAGQEQTAAPAVEEATAVVGTPEPEDIAEASLGTRTFIPHTLEVPPFTPPPPPVVKRLPYVRVDASITSLSKNGRTLTLQRGEPSTEPDLPPPPPPPPYVEPRVPTPEEIARRIWHLRHNFNFGATVFDHKISVVNWTDPISLVRYEAVCGFDIGLLAGVGDFVHKGGKYNLFLLHSHFDTTRMRRVASQWNLKIPDVAPGEILITRGDVNDSAAIAPMTVIKEIIEAETPRLLAYQAARQTHAAAAAAWHAANPPIPRDETFILRPHRGSRYLPANKPTQPADQ
jgi:hypothetical protein